MSSLQTALRHGARRWTRMLPSWRNSVTSHKVASTSLPDSSICYSRNYSKVHNLKDGLASQNTVLHEVDAQKVSPDEAVKNAQQFVKSTHEALARASVTYGSTFTNMWQYLLTDWTRQVKELQNDKMPVDLDSIVTKQLSTIVDLVLTPSSPPEWRHACLVLLLSQDIDQELTDRVLNHTVEDASHLPLRVLFDIILTLTTCVQTPLRVETRKRLVTAIINQRHYEITAKYVVLLMYQMDELFDMKQICRQQPHKDGRRKPGDEGIKNRNSGKHGGALVGKEEFTNDSLEPKALGSSDEVLVCRQQPHKDGRRKPGDEGIKNRNSGKHGGALVGKEEFTNDSLEPKALGSSDEVQYAMSMNIEQRAASVVSDFKTKDLARIMMLLAKWRNRNETLINAVIHRLCQADLSDFHFIQLKNLLFSFSVLNIHNHQVLWQIAQHLTQATPATPSLVCDVLTSLSYLRWNDEVLVSKYLCFLADHMSELTSKDAHSVLMSLANLYIVPKTDAETNMVKELANRTLDGDVRPASKVNCAWCLAVLLSLGAELGESLLQPEFMYQFSDVDDAQKQTCFHKLCSISSALQYEVKGYSGTGSHLSEALLTSARQDGSGCSDKVMSSELVKCLQMFVDLKGYVSLGHALTDGLVADAVMCANLSGELRPLNVIQDENIYKLAIQLVPFSGLLHVTESPCGSYSMTARHWKHLGYVPVQILYSDLKPSLSGLEKISNIKTKIQAAVQEYVAEKQSLQL